MSLTPRHLAALLLSATLAGCASFERDPLHIDLAGLEPLPSEGLELRFALKIRVQNPNDHSISYNGVALKLNVNGQPLASGVSDQTGAVPRFGESVITVPVTLSALSAVRQVWGAADWQAGQAVPYRLTGKLAGGLFGTRRFSDSGTLNWPQATP